MFMFVRLLFGISTLLTFLACLGLVHKAIKLVTFWSCFRNKALGFIVFLWACSCLGFFLARSGNMNESRLEHFLSHAKERLFV